MFNRRNTRVLASNFERSFLHLVADSGPDLFLVDFLKSLLRLDIVNVHSIRIINESHEPALFLLFLYFLGDLFLDLLFVCLAPLLVGQVPAPVGFSIHVFLEHRTHRSISSL